MQGKRLFQILLMTAITSLATVTPGNADTNGSVGTVRKTVSFNLFKRVLELNSRLSWEDHEDDALPAGLCETLLPNCLNKALPYKILGFPLAIRGRQEQWAIILAWTVDQDHPDIVILASVVDGSGTFFLLSPDGKLRKCAYSTKNVPWTSLANSAVRDQFEREKQEWLNWFTSLDGVGAGAIH
jgi:hypothetical protein